MPAFAGDCALCAAAERTKTRARSGHDDGLRTFAPRWSRFAYELWIVPETPRRRAGRDRRADGRSCTRPAGCAPCSGEASPGTPSCTRRRFAASTAFHWHVEIWPRLAVAASIELGAGIWVNIVDPDVAARELRSA